MGTPAVVSIDRKVRRDESRVLGSVGAVAGVPRRSRSEAQARAWIASFKRRRLMVLDALEMKNRALREELTRRTKEKRCSVHVSPF